MKKPSFVYVTYIATTPEKVWQALTETDVTRRYWLGNKTNPAHVNVSDWKPGSRWEHRRVDATNAADIAGTVVEATPPRRLVMTWARPSDFEDLTKHSRVTFDVEQDSAGVVKLTVLHEDLEKDPKMYEGVSTGWPMVLSNLKSFLETGRPVTVQPTTTVGAAHANA